MDEVTELKQRLKDAEQDLADQGRTIKQLRHERDLLYRMIDTTPDYIYFKDERSRFVISNRAHLGILGATDRKQVMGKTDFDFFPSDLASRYLLDEESVLQTGEPVVDREEPVKDRAGIPMWLSTTKVPLHDEGGRIVGLVGVSRDISARKQAEQEKAALEDQLRQGQKLESIGQLAGGIAHDFNNMLGAISGYADIIRRKFGAANPTLTEYIDIIIDASKRAADLTSKLLAFARKGTYEMQPLDVHDTVSDVIKLLEHTLDKKIVISTSLHARPSTVKGDRTQLQNAVLNLSVNARDAMPRGGELKFETKSVALDARYIHKHLHKIEPGHYVMLSVSDTGVGMDAETKMRIFEPFFTTKEVGKGTGLGLASVYGTVKSHHGAIEVDSEVGAGATLTIFLPLVDAQIRKQAPVSRPAQSGKARILVVDDEEMLRKMAARMLEELGYTVDVCADGEDAVEFYHIHKDAIDVVVVDMIMPRMGGYDCVNRLKEINPRVKVIITTGYSLTSETQRIVTKGISGFLQKPFDMSEFAETIADVVKGSGR